MSPQDTNIQPDQDFYRAFFDEAPDMFVSVDSDTAIIKFCNRTLCDRLGYAKEELVGQPLKILYHSAHHDEVDKVFNDFIEFGQAQNDHLQLITAGGLPIDVSLRVSSHRDEHGRIVESRSILRDISLDRHVKQLKLELRLQDAQKMESLALLAGGIAHDFNNMLVSILGNASLGLLEIPSESPVRGRLTSIETAAQRAADLTKQLLAYSGSVNHEQSQFDLSKVVEEMGHLLQVAISRKVVLNFDLAHDPVYVLGDITQIRQIIMNLLTNGSDAVGDRSGMIIIRTGLQIVDQEYLDNSLYNSGIEPGCFGYLEVSDTGRGISSADQRRMFDPFFTTKAKGHGLGLAAVLGIVRAHGGTLRVYSEIDRGTTVKVLFPVGEYQPSEVDNGPAEGRVNGEHVLLVDDEENVLAVTKRMLEYYGFKVTLAMDGREALSKYIENPAAYDLVLMDITMPHLDGISAYKTMSDMDPTAKVVLMSGYSEQQATNALTGRTFGGFIQKPFQPKTLLRTLLSALGSK